jgi:tryptophanyl-tRNA synthetase
MRIFSGIQPTGAKHFGNYSGGFRQYVATQELGDAMFCIVDLHSITVDFEPADLRERTLDLAALLLATGIDPERSILFVQSHIPAHTQAAWLLSAVATFGELRRMTQFKDKAEQQSVASAGLFTYPVLMAADILLYQADAVPIGDDQRQHLELARRIAERFNARFDELLTVPEGIVPTVGARIMDLQQPTKKMSTTGGTEQGTIGMLDAPDVLTKKIGSAVTDSGREIRYDPAAKPGVSNLMEILHIATGEEIAAIETRFAGVTYREFKGDVAAAVEAMLGSIRERYGTLRADEVRLHALLAEGAERAQSLAGPTLERMYASMGFVSPS